MQQPRKSHMRPAHRVLWYLRDTPTLGPWYAAGGSHSFITLRGWCDSDWGGNPDSRRSTTGYVFSFGSGTVSWISKKQSIVALSSTEAEYRAACSATCEVIWIQRLLLAESWASPSRRLCLQLTTKVVSPLLGTRSFMPGPSI